MNKEKFIEKISPNELSLLIGLTTYRTYEKGSEEGWMLMNDIIQSGAFKSQKTNFPTYINRLIKKGLIEKEYVIYKDKRNREVGKWYYRLKKDKKTRYNIYCLFLASQINYQNPSIFKTDYFQKINDTYKEMYEKVIDEKIKEYEIQLYRYKFIKHQLDLRKRK